jgi:tungstate transport system permease protein
LRTIILLSFRISLTGSNARLRSERPLGAALAVYRFFGRGMLVVIANTLLDLPRQSLGLPFIPCL